MWLLCAVGANNMTYCEHVQAQDKLMLKALRPRLTIVFAEPTTKGRYRISDLDRDQSSDSFGSTHVARSSFDLTPVLLAFLNDDHF